MIALLFACNAEPLMIQVRGTVTASRDADSEPLGGITVEARDYTLESVDSAVSADDGTFELTTTGGTFLALTLSGEGYVPTSFTGVTGTEDLELTPGQAWVRSEADDEALRTLFADCPEAEAEGSIIEGEVRFVVEGAELADPEQDWPLAATAWVEVTDTEGGVHAGCYLDDEGVAAAPDNTQTGEMGRFAVFGLSEGKSLIHVGYDGETETLWEGWAEYWSPAEGVAPIYPLAVQLL